MTLSGRRRRGPSASGAGEIELSMTHSRELAAGGLRRRRGCLSRSTPRRRCSAAEEATTSDELMARAGRAVAEAAMRPLSRRARVSRSAAGARTAATAGSRRAARGPRIVEPAEDAPIDEADVIVDALFGTGFQGEPRAGGGAADRGRSTRPACPSSRSTCPRAWTPPRARSRARRAGDRDRDVARAEGRPRVAPGRFHAGEVEVADIGLEPGRDRAPARHAGDPRGCSAASRERQQVHGRARCSSSAARAG